jgi:formylglycine-generating enzyme required for sulfatase activity
MTTNLQRLIITIFLFLVVFEVNSQSLVVKSFRKLETDQNARMVSPKTDQNGKKCAIIKVVTSQTGFVFDFGMIGNAIATEQHTGELWIWVPAGARKVTISHQQLGVLRDYQFDIDIEEATVYEMVLTTGKVTTVVEEQIASQFLVINTIPTGADVYIDDNASGQTTYQKELSLGKHTYRISRDMYLPTAGTVILTADKKETLNLTLKPDFGTLKITTSPDGGAAVSIDGVATEKTTPCTIEQLKSGEHSVTLRLEMYKTATEKINIQAGGNHNLPVSLTPTYAQITVNTDPASDIYVAGEKKGNGAWSGKLLPGIYQFEARKEKYTPATEKREVIIGQPLTLTLQPVAKKGIITIMTTPADATIMLDGVSKGTTPTKLRDLLVGDYTMTLSLPNYATITKTVTITEGKNTEVSEALIKGRAVAINSNPSGVVLFVDGNNVGLTPYNGSLTFGSHTLKIEQNGEKSEKTITISQLGGDTSFMISFDPESFTETVNGVNIEILAIKGGTFLMGSPANEVGRDDSETQHQVSVSNFYIGKYEVTQAQWKAIMGNNPSRFKGDDLPIENVSWNDVQEFLQKLNEKTGKSFRLPTEAEWEYAARGGTRSRNYFYAGGNTLNKMAWFMDNSNKTTHSVGSKQPNELGIYDMSGNVWEWCNDWYSKDYYSKSPQSNPTGTASGSGRVRRGGSWGLVDSGCHVAFRSYDTPGSHNYFIGFRLCSSL